MNRSGIFHAHRKRRGKKFVPLFVGMKLNHFRVTRGIGDFRFKKNQNCRSARKSRLPIFGTKRIARARKDDCIVVSKRREAWHRKCRGYRFPFTGCDGKFFLGKTRPRNKIVIWFRIEKLRRTGFTIRRELHKINLDMFFRTPIVFHLDRCGNTRPRFGDEIDRKRRCDHAKFPRLRGHFANTRKNRRKK